MSQTEITSNVTHAEILWTRERLMQPSGLNQSRLFCVDQSLTISYIKSVGGILSGETISALTTGENIL